MINASPRFTYEQIEQRLLAMPRFSDVGSRAANFALDQIRSFFQDAGNFSAHIPAIHVAGTNGKGTLCSMLSAVFTQEGYRTGLYTSPHLTDVRERFRIDGEPMPKEELIAFFEEMDVLLKRHPLTFFELTTVIAFWYFNKKGVDIAIIETGLGGRLDATNIIMPKCAVITSIGMDHTEQLGNTLELIAGEKAGILKEKIPFVLGDIDDSSRNVIMSTADRVGAAYKQRTPFPVAVTTDLPSSFEQTNIDCAYTVLNVLREDFPVTDNNFVKALTRIRELSGLRGRMERLHAERLLYFDGSHNEPGLNAIVSFLSTRFDLSEAILVVGMMQDKLKPAINSIFSPFGKVYFYEINQPRAAKFDVFKEICPDAEIFDASEKSLSDLFEHSKTQLVLFTGSFYFYSVVSEWMGSLKTTTPKKLSSASQDDTVPPNTDL